MALVGDMIFRVRSKIPDVPLTLAPPVNFTAVGQNNAGGGLSAGTFYIQICYLTPWGITLPSAEVTVNGVVNSIFITMSDNPITGTGLPYGASGFRVYIGSTAGGESMFADFYTANAPSTLQPAANQAIMTTVNGSGGVPLRSTAYLMDTDGVMFGASTVYDWLNDALVNISRAVGGLLDYCGVPTVAGQPLYVMPGEWVEVSDVWYSGYWVQGGKRGDFFRRDAITTSILNNATVSVFTEKQVMEVSYQPDRNSGSTVTTAAMGVSDTSVAVNDSSGFLLPFGFAQIGSEIVAYSSLSPFGGLIRGLGSSVAQAWPSGTAVKELSLFWCGKRLFTTKYNPGQSMVTLAAPVGWESIVPIYMLGLAKDAELDTAEGQKKKQEALQMAKDWLAGNRGVARFVQVGGYGAGNSAQTFNNTIAGGVIVP